MDGINNNGFNNNTLNYGAWLIHQLDARETRDQSGVKEEWKRSKTKSEIEWNRMKKSGKRLKKDWKEELASFSRRPPGRWVHLFLL